MEFSLPKYPDIRVREVKDGAKFFDVSRKEFICVQHHSWSQIKTILQENSKDASFDCLECMNVGLNFPKSDLRLKKEVFDCLDLITLNLLSFYMIGLSFPVSFDYAEKYKTLFQDQLWEIINRLEFSVGKLSVNRRTVLWNDILKKEFKMLVESALPKFFFGMMDTVGYSFEGAKGPYFSEPRGAPDSLTEVVYADWVFPTEEYPSIFGAEYRTQKGAQSIESEMLRLEERTYFDYIRSIHVLLFALGWQIMTKTKADPRWKLTTNESEFKHLKAFVRNDTERKMFISQWKAIPYFVSVHKSFNELWNVLIDGLFV